MRTKKRIFIVTLILFFVVSFSKITFAADANFSISEGVLDGNKITFKINMPEGAGLIGDANDNGVLDSDFADSYLIQEFLVQLITANDLNLILSDADRNGEIEMADVISINQLVLKKSNYITLTGDLAENSTGNLYRNDSKEWIIEVTVPENTTEGSITVNLASEIFMTSEKVANEELTQTYTFTKSEDNSGDNEGDNEDSDTFKVVSEKQEEQENGKMKVTITVNKELDSTKLPEGWELSEDGKSISKVMEKGQTETIKLVSKDGEEIEYTVNVKDATSTDLEVISKNEEPHSSGKVKVTITVNKELDPNKLPEGWELSEDGKSISKIMAEGAEEKITLVALDGSTLDYTVKVSNSQANTDLSDTGSKYTLVFVSIAIVAVALFIFKKSRKLKDIDVNTKK